MGQEVLAAWTKGATSVPAEHLEGLCQPGLPAAERGMSKTLVALDTGLNTGLSIPSPSFRKWVRRELSPPHWLSFGLSLSSSRCVLMRARGGKEPN